jgi:hypothetical protein
MVSELMAIAKTAGDCPLFCGCLRRDGRRKKRGLSPCPQAVFGLAFSPFPSLFAVNEGVSLLERLDPTQRAAVLAALFGLVLVGLALVTFIWLGGRFVRRQNRRNPPQRPPLQSDWDRKQPGGTNDPPPGP